MVKSLVLNTKHIPILAEPPLSAPLGTRTAVPIGQRQSATADRQAAKPGETWWNMVIWIAPSMYWMQNKCGVMVCNNQLPALAWHGIVGLQKTKHPEKPPKKVCVRVKYGMYSWARRRVISCDIFVLHNSWEFLPPKAMEIPLRPNWVPEARLQVVVILVICMVQVHTCRVF